MEKDKQANASVIRVHKDRNYTVMSNKHLFQKDLSLKAKGLLSVFLALPNDWNYSIAGLCSIVKEGRDALNAAISELKKFGYVEIERKNSESGRFVFIYNIYEQGKITPYMENPYTVKSDMENPKSDSPCLENPQQLNTNIINTDEQKTNGSLVNSNEFTLKELVNLYNLICIHFPKVTKTTDTRKKKAALRLKEYPQENFWKTVFTKAENSNFIRSSKFFNLDWLLKNDTNASKVFEGNYDNKNKVISVEFAENKANKYSQCYKAGGVK